MANNQVPKGGMPPAPSEAAAPGPWLVQAMWTRQKNIAYGVYRERPGTLAEWMRGPSGREKRFRSKAGARAAIMHRMRSDHDTGEDRYPDDPMIPGTREALGTEPSEAGIDHVECENCGAYFKCLMCGSNVGEVVPIAARTGSPPGPQASEAENALRWIMRAAESAKEPCGMDPESPAARRNFAFASIAQAAAQGLGMMRGPSLACAGIASEAEERKAFEAWADLHEDLGGITHLDAQNRFAAKRTRVAWDAWIARAALGRVPGSTT